MSQDSERLDSVLDKVLATHASRLSADRRTVLASEIIDALDAQGLLAVDVMTVEVPCARVPVESVEAYGLTIELDANGDAVTVHSKHGLQVSETA